ncbi:protein SpAN-like [Palaemon carinicauda]|uniref:protein SpAN-like n=1 Tax=Palaemon carinicauda TaxID=392227 RepID=UPI0035B59738
MVLLILAIITAGIVQDKTVSAVLEPMPVEDAILIELQKNPQKLSHQDEGEGDGVLYDSLGSLVIGDMIVSGEQTQYWFSQVRRMGAKDPLMLWRKEKGHPIVPYNISGEGEKFLAAVKDGMQHWENTTCVRFRSVKGNDKSFINFLIGDGCWSRVGRRQDNKPQDISLGRGCQFMGTAAHEIGHALGLLHEHMRSDRDDYIQIVDKNIQRGNEHNFMKDTSESFSNYGVPYDYTSLMHYTGEAFSKNGGLTIISSNPLLQGMLGRNRVLSHRDTLIANKMYGCIKMWSDRCFIYDSPCQNDGYVGPNCDCVCPRGTTGPYCETVLHDYYSERMSKCTMVINQTNTTIETPRYPNFLEPDTWCVFKVIAPTDYIIQILFEDFSLEAYSTSQCSLGSLRLMEYQNDVIADTMACGKYFERGETFTSVTNELVMFLDIWRNSKRSKGFRGLVTFVKKNEATSNSEHGIIISVSVPFLGLFLHYLYLIAFL